MPSTVLNALDALTHLISILQVRLSLCVPTCSVVSDSFLTP